MKIKRFGAILVMICVIGSFHTAMAAQGSTEDEDFKLEYELQSSEWEQREWELAMDSGIIPETLSYQGDITAQEFVELIQNMIRACSGDSTVLEQHLRQDSLNQQSVMRQDAALALALAATGIGINSQIPNNHNVCFYEMDDLVENSALFTYTNADVQTVYVDQMDSYELGMLHWGVSYACTQASLESGMNLIVPAADQFLCSQPISRKDAILGVWRLMTSREETPDYITVEAAKTEGYNPEIITDELLNWANDHSALPEISNQVVPQYRGACIQNKSSGYLYSSNTEQQIKALSEIGVLAFICNIGLSELRHNPNQPK